MAEAFAGLHWRPDLPASLRAGAESVLAAAAETPGGAPAGGRVVQDAAGTIVAIDDASLEVLGLTWNQVSGVRAAQRQPNVLGPDGLPLPLDRAPTVIAMRTGRPVRDCLLGVVPPRGARRRHTLWVEVDAQPVVGADGRVLGAVSWFRDATDSERARDASAAIEAAFRTLAEDAVDLVTRHRPDGRVLYASPSASSVLGMAPNLLLGRDFRELCHPDDLAEAFGPARPGEGDVRVAAYRMRHADGRWVDVETSSRRIRDPDGSVVEVHAVTRDVSRRLALERRAAAAEAEFRLLAENSSDVVLRTTPDGRCSWISPSVQRVLGYEPAAVVGTDVTDHAHPDERVLFRDDLPELIGAGRLATIEGRFRTRAGDYRWLAARVQPLFDDGRFDGAVVSLRDVHDEVVARQALAESEDRFRAAMRGAATGIALVSPEGRFLEVNEALCAYLGFAETDLLAMAVDDVTHPDDVESDRAGVNELLSGRIPVWRSRKRYVRSDGSTVWADVSSAVVRGPEGTPLYRVSQVADATAEVRARADLAASEARFRLIAENAQDVVVTFDGQGLVTWATPSLTTLLGWDPTEVLGLPGRDFVDPASAAPTRGIAALTLGEPVADEVRMRCKDGTYRWVVVRTVLNRDAQSGEVIGVAAIRDAQAEVEARAALAYRATHDALTGLTNRHSLVERMQHVLDASSPSSRGLAVLFCDLDNLKAVNDRFGHDAGDRLIREVAERIRAEVRPEDVAARFGGDEFVVVLEGVEDPAVAAERAERIRAAVSRPFDVDGVAVLATTSVGVALAAPGDDAESAIREADAALYRAKHEGRDQVRLAAG